MTPFLITLKHDDGEIKIRTNAVTFKQAVATVLSMEKAPRRALVGARMMNKTETRAGMACLRF